MYKKYNFQPKSLSPRDHHSFYAGGNKKLDISTLAEKLVPFLIIATGFVWLWK